MVLLGATACLDILMLNRISPGGQTSHTEKLLIDLELGCIGIEWQCRSIPKAGVYDSRVNSP